MTEFEFDLIWMAMRYCMPRQTIASATFPTDVVMEYWDALGPNRRERLYNDLVRYIGGGGEFGNPKIDAPIWFKFMSALNEKEHVEMTVDGVTFKAFQANGRWYPLKEYLETPSHEIYVPDECVPVKATP